MNKTISVAIPASLFVRLANFLEEEGSDRDPVTVVADAIDYWIENASWKQADLMPETLTSGLRGYTWKHNDRCLFLPHGTELRQPYRGQYQYAKVEGDEIKYNGNTISPGKLANTIARCSCNAWTHIWIKRPRDTEWMLADQLSPSAKSKARAESADKLLAELDSMRT
jgi:hypothetical protein